ncbi:MAG TPA: hypothetical protein PLJ15_00920, partial [Candidatus Omnitrophota bacterium]|nr:hypothetical protein [Candidatus Omnitrophota bacterium]
MKKKSKKILSFLIIFLFIFEQSGFAQIAGALDLSSTFKSLSNSFIQDKFRPVHLRSLAYNNAANDFRLMLDRGDAKDINNTGIEVSTKTLLKYFFIGISIPNDKFWVNLRPDADENIIDPVLARTDAGKILLEADLQLKKDTALATSPETPEGKEYWGKLYKKAGEIFGSDSVSIPTLTRPWIVPGEIIIRETDNNAYVYKATLKVMLEQDYLKGSDVYNFKDPRQEKLNEYSSELIRKIIIPKLTKEINTSKRYAPLRQLYYSLILAQWFKSRFRGKGGIYAQSIDKERLNGLTSQESWSKTTYFKEYQDSFKNGEYNLKVPVATITGQAIRSYFSGGIKPLVEEMPLPPSASSPVRALGPVTVIYAKRGFPTGSKVISSVKVANLKPSVNDLLSGMVITEDNPAAYSSSPVESDMTRRNWLAAVMGGAVAVAVGTKLNQAGRSSVIEEEGPTETPALKEEVNIWGGYPAGEQVWLNFRDNSNLPAELQSDIYGKNRDGRHNLNNLYIAVVFALLSKTDPFFAVAHYIQEGREDAGMNFDIPGAVLNEEFWANVIQPRYRRVYGKEIPFSIDSWSGILSDPYLGPFIYRSIVEEKIAYYPEELAFRNNDFVAANKTNDIRMSAKSIQLYQGFGSISLGNGKYTNYRKAGPYQYQYGYSLLAIMRMLQQGENRKIIDEVIKRAKENIPASMIEKISELDGGIEPFILPAGNVNGRFVETLDFNAKAKPEGLENAGKKSGVKQVKPENGLFLTGGKIISTAGWLSMATGASVYAVKFIADWRNESIARQSENFTLEEFNAARDRVLAAKGLNSLDVLHKTVLVVVIKDRLDRQLGRVATLRDIYNQIERMLPSQLESIVDEFEQSISDDEDSSTSGEGSASSPIKKENAPNANSQKNERRNAVLSKYNLVPSD